MGPKETAEIWGWAPGDPRTLENFEIGGKDTGGSKGISWGPFQIKKPVKGPGGPIGVHTMKNLFYTRLKGPLGPYIGSRAAGAVRASVFFFPVTIFF